MNSKTSTKSTTFTADQESNVELMRKLYSKLADLITIDQGGQRMGGTHLVLFPNGGTILDPRLNPDSDEADRRVLITNFMDIKIEEGWIASIDRQSPMSDVYKAILTQTETPDFELNSDEERKLKKLVGKLYIRPGRPNERLQDYRWAQDNIFKSYSDIEVWRKTHVGQPAPIHLVQQLRRAKADYTDVGGSETAAWLKKIDELQKKRGVFWMEDLNIAFDANYNPTSRYGNVDYYPTYKNWVDNRLNWSAISATARDLEEQSTNSHTSYSGGLSASWGMWSFGGAYARDETRSHEQSEISNLNLSFEVTQVSLRYPWMSTALIESRVWRWLRTSIYHGKLVSDGVFDPEGRTSGTSEVMPLIPTSLVLARNVSLSANWSFNLEDKFRQVERGQSSAGWGPFRIGGRYFNEENKRYKKANVRGTGVSFDSPQIIGFFAHMPRKSPDPDNNLPWPAAFVDFNPEDDPIIKAVNEMLEKAEKDDCK